MLQHHEVNFLLFAIAGMIARSNWST